MGTVWKRWMIALCGLWEFGDIAALFTPGFGEIHPFLWNHILVGFILMVAGVGAARTRAANTAKTLLWAAAGAGGWLVIASFFIFSPTHPVGLWNDVIVGGVVLILGFWGALEGRSNPVSG